MNDGFSTETFDSTLFRGEILKFNKGEWLLGGVPFDPKGVAFVATGMVCVWTRWNEERQPEHHPTPPGGKHPDRSAWPDQDETLWPPGLDGKPVDPWQNGRYVYLANRRTAEDATFVTASVGGRRAVTVLQGAIKNMRAENPDAFAIVELGTEKMPAKNRTITVQKPKFVIVDWTKGFRGPPLKIEPPNFSKRLDDEIPDFG